MMYSEETKQPFERVKLDNGVYDAKIGALREWQNEQGVAKLILECEITSGSAKGKKIGAFYTKKITSNTNLGKLLVNMGHGAVVEKAGTEFDETTLIGSPIKIVVQNVPSKKTGELVSVVQSIFKA